MMMTMQTVMITVHPCSVSKEPGEVHASLYVMAWRTVIISAHRWEGVGWGARMGIQSLARHLQPDSVTACLTESQGLKT